MKVIKDYNFKTPSGQTINGKIIKGYVALYIASDYWIVAKGYSLYKFYPIDERIEFFSQLKDGNTGLLSKNKFLRRLLRAEITHLYRFKDDWFCIARKAIYKYNKLTGLFEKCHTILRGSRPMNLCQDKDGTIYYGEYFYNPKQVPVNIFKSTDAGETWEVAYTFEASSINHVHGLFIDKFSDRLWIFTGDDDNGCIAGWTTDGFKTFHVEFEGNQKFRVCVPLFLPNEIIYPTDSQYTSNSIRCINRNSKELRDLQPIQGSGIYALDANNIYAVSTTVEPSEVNLDKFSHIWYSFNGYDWAELTSFKKDCLPCRFFQFGSIRFPHYETSSDYLIFTGRAIKKIDQSTLFININQLK